MKKRIVCIISGRVQGVLYRDFTRRTANRIGICGEVENQDDGTVFVEAEGEEENLTLFKNHLKKGSTFSKVENVSCEYFLDLKNFKDFKIKYKSLFDRF
jgi:acylphosphatase